MRYLGSVLSRGSCWETELSVGVMGWPPRPGDRPLYPRHAVQGAQGFPFSVSFSCDLLSGPEVSVQCAGPSSSGLGGGPEVSSQSSVVGPTLVTWVEAHLQYIYIPYYQNIMTLNQESPTCIINNSQSLKETVAHIN